MKTDEAIAKSAPALAATPERGLSTAPTTGAWASEERQATVPMPIAAAMAVRLGLPGVPRSPGSPLPPPLRTDAPTVPSMVRSAPVPSSGGQAEAAPRIDVVLRDDGAGEVLVDGTSVIDGTDVARTYAAIVALVLDTAGRAGRPAQVRVVSSQGIHRTLVAPDGSVRQLAVGVPHDGDVSAAEASPAGALSAPPAPPNPQRLAPASPWPGLPPQDTVPSRTALPPSVLSVTAAQASPAGLSTAAAVAPPQPAPTYAPVGLPAEPVLPAEPLPTVPTASSGLAARYSGMEESNSLLTGPALPQGGVRSPENGLPVRSCPPAALVVLGVHGGAGESTLAALVPGWHAANHAWPVPSSGRQPTVLVARTNLVGLTAVRTAVAQWATGHVPQVELVGLVLLADAPDRLPRPLRDLATAASSAVPHVWHIPWVKGWRTSLPQLSETPRAVRRLVHQLETLTRPGLVGT